MWKIAKHFINYRMQEYSKPKWKCMVLLYIQKEIIAETLQQI